jgi:TolA-binding protein
MTDAKDMAGAGREHAEDLSALARRRELSEAEARRLGLCLASSDALRALHDTGCDFDELETDRPGDTELVARIAARARKRAAAQGRAGSVRRRGLALWLGGGIVMAGTMAAAATVLHIVRPPRPEQPNYGVRSTEEPVGQKGSGLSVRARAAEPGERESSEVPGRVPPLEDADRDSSKPDPSLRVERSAHDARSRTAKLEEPARLFSLANGARRRGELDKSLGIYRELQRRFPGSPEAVLSHVMVGRLQLGRGSSTLALAEFGRYLRAEPRGALAQEAMEGKARALQRLGRVTEERAAWRQLLSRYPRSIYARTARERLGGSD